MNLNTRCILRNEEIEQTTDYVKLAFRAFEFENIRGTLSYRMYRNRSLGEFVLI